MFHVTFPEVARVLSEARSNVPAAESHGCLCGALCVVPEYSVDAWLEEIVPDVSELGDRREPLERLFEDTVRALRGDQMEFQPLLPDDDASLQDRAAALAQWCQGFLYGFGSARTLEKERLPANVDEILRDLTQIGRATVSVDEDDESQEQAYADVIEYLRVGVQLIHLQLHDVRHEQRQQH